MVTLSSIKNCPEYSAQASPLLWAEFAGQPRIASKRRQGIANSRATKWLSRFVN
jgi:hypothetical protein